MAVLLEVADLVKHFPVHGGFLNRAVARVHAVNGVSFTVDRGETLGIVGESGCGKSTLGKTVIRLLEPTAGTIRFDGNDISHLEHRALMPFRRRMQIIFQDPYSSLNPRLTVKAAIGEGLRFHDLVSGAELDEHVRRLMERVGLRADDRDKYPHEFSGGQRQRIGIARALSLEPDLVIADEPVSALDVSIQAQVLNLMMDLREELGLTMVFISHDLKVIEHFADRILVMYLGHVVEELPAADVHQRAAHPYTRALLGANPIDDPRDRRELSVLEGDVPSPFDPPSGCPFRGRCPIAERRCEGEMPQLTRRAGDQRVACFAV